MKSEDSLARSVNDYDCNKYDRGWYNTMTDSASCNSLIVKRLRVDLAWDMTSRRCHFSCAPGPCLSFSTVLMPLVGHPTVVVAHIFALICKTGHRIVIEDLRYTGSILLHENQF